MNDALTRALEPLRPAFRADDMLKAVFQPAVPQVGGGQGPPRDAA